MCGHRLGGAPAQAPASQPKPVAAPASQPASQPQAQARPASAPPANKGLPPSAMGLAPMRGPTTDPYVGGTLNNRFKIEAKLGEGGFGAVYRGTQMGTGRKVAIKLLHPEMTRDENLVARFKREGLVLCNLRDAHTITTYDFDQTPEGTLYIAMELLEGRSLHQVFHDEAPIAWQRVMTILSMMCSSLAEAHAQGIVHRDLKPENVYLEKRPNHPEFVKILDFGIAKVMRGEGSVDPQAPQLTATGQTLGTLEYMSPEQLMGKQLDGRSDIYALGVLGYELLTGRLPFPDAKGPAGLITAQLKQTPKAPSAVNAAGAIPAGVDRIVLKCLEKDKNHRFSDVNALARALQDCLHAGGQWGSDPVPAAAPVAAPAARPQMATTKGEPLGGLPPQMPGTPHTPPPGAVAPYQAPAMQSGAQHQRPQTPPPQLQSQPGMQSPGMQQSPAMMSGVQHGAPPPAGAIDAPSTAVALRASKSGSRTWVILVVAILLLGAIAGAALAMFA